MTAYQNEGGVCRKSSVYNQTGETYFQQLTAYNHMSAHLRRVLLAPCVVDSRNKRYMRDRGLGRGRSGRSKSLDKIRMREDIIDGVAYDTEHHPLDVLRMSLECSADCRQRVKRVLDVCKRCNDWSARSRTGFTSGGVAQRSVTRGKSGGAACPCVGSPSCKFGSASAPKRGSGKSIGTSGNTHRVVVPLIGNRSESKRSVGGRAAKPAPSRSEIDRAESSYSYDSSFESSSEASTAPGSPVLKKSASSRDSQAESLDGQTGGVTETAETAEEAKYAKFVYDVTQEIMINGLYTDDELRAVFRKHVYANSSTLDRNRMQSEIRELKMSLNLPEHSDDEDNDDVARFADVGVFAKFIAEKPPTPGDNKHAEKPRNLETVRFDETRKPRNSYGKSAVRADANPELLITERDVFLTLAEMKLDPRQIQSICKSLHDKSREMARTQTVQIDAEAPYPLMRQDRAHPQIKSRTECPATDFCCPYGDRMIRPTGGGARKTDICQGVCRESYARVDCSTEKSQVLPEMATQASLHDTRGVTSRMTTRSRSLDGISEASLRTRSNAEPRKIDEVPEIDPSLDFTLETKSALKNYGSQKQMEKARKAESVEHIAPTDTRHSSRDTEEPRISFVSHSEFLNNLKKDDASSLPDISERSEGVTGDIETVSDEIFTVGSQTTPRRSQIDEATEHFSQVDVAPITEELSTSIAAQSIGIFEESSRSEVAEAGVSKESEISVIEENYEAEPSPSLFQRESDDSEIDEVVVASLESLSSAAISPKVSSSPLSPDVHKKEEFVAGASTVSPVSTPRMPKNTDDKSKGNTNGETPSKSAAKDSDKSAEDVAKAARPVDGNSLKVEQGRATPNSEDKAGVTLSIETELEHLEILSSTSETHNNVHVKEETASVYSAVKSPEASDHDEESEESHKFSEQSAGRPMSVVEISKSEMDVLNTESDSNRSLKNLQVAAIESGKPRKEKKSISSRLFIRLIGMGNRRDNAKSQSEADTEMSEKKSRIKEKDEEQRRTKFVNYPITTASDISFLRKQNLSDSAQSPIETFIDTPYIKNESTSRNLEKRPEVSSLRRDSKQGGNTISKRMKAAMEHLIKRSGKSNEFRDEATQISPIKVSFMTTTGIQVTGAASPRKYAEEELPSALAVKTQNPNCLCVLASALVESNKNGNCRSDCRGQEFVCDHRCSKFYRSLR